MLLIDARNQTFTQLGKKLPGYSCRNSYEADEAHFDNIKPRSDLIFVDYACFMQDAWEQIGLYLEILSRTVIGQVPGTCGAYCCCGASTPEACRRQVILSSAVFSHH